MIPRILLAGLMALKIATPEEFKDEIPPDEFIEYDSPYDSSLSKLLEAVSIKLGLDNTATENDPDEIYFTYESPTLKRNRSTRQYQQNVVIFEGSFDGDDVQLVIPESDLSKLNIIDGYLVNVGSSSVTGRMLYNGDSLDPNEYDTYSYILNPIYGNPANVYRYGSYNYQRHYYENSYNNGISYTDLYGKFFVDDYKVYYSSDNKLYYAFLVMLLFMGVSFIWTRRTSRH